MLWRGLRRGRVKAFLLQDRMLVGDVDHVGLFSQVKPTALQPYALIGGRVAAVQPDVEMKNQCRAKCRRVFRLPADQRAFTSEPTPPWVLRQRSA
jgi:hypothetical protein